MINQTEMWRDIEGYGGNYQVSNYGRIKSKKKILKTFLSTNGYYRVRLYSNKKGREYKVHRLVAKAFIENIDNKPIVNHKDGNKLNNNANNLEWCTQAENIKHALKSGLKKRLFIAENELKKMYLEEKKTTKEIAEMYGVTGTTILKRLEEYGIKRRTKGEMQDKYNIPLEKLLEDLKNNERNVDLSKKYNCTKGIIATRKYQFRKRGLL